MIFAASLGLDYDIIGCTLFTYRFKLIVLVEQCTQLPESK